MSVRKRAWTTPNGEYRAAWVIDYRDSNGHRTHETFSTKKAAQARHDEVAVLRRDYGVIARSRSLTVREWAEQWKAARAQEVERATALMHRQHVGHIVKVCGTVKLADLKYTAVAPILDRLRQQGHSADMVKRLRATLGSILQFGAERSHCRNVIAEGAGKQPKKKRGQQRPLKIGVDIPTREDVAAILNNADRRWRPALLFAAYTGLRVSELRGLRWSDVDLKAKQVTVSQRADRYNDMGAPKSHSSHRTVPFGKVVVATLKEWKLACPKGELGLVFPNSKGKPDANASIVKAYIAAQVAAWEKAKYTGIHSLRHFYASWCINRKADGGLELPPKNVQERLGHSSITMTLDRYGHLFPKAVDQEIDAAEIALMQA